MRKYMNAYSKNGMFGHPNNDPTALALGTLSVAQPQATRKLQRSFGTHVFLLAGASAVMHFVETSTARGLCCYLKCSAAQLLFTVMSTFLWL